MTDIELRRLKWSCRRGLLELDLIFDRYFKRHTPDPKLAELLELPDNDLLDIVMGRSDDYASHLKPLVAHLRTA